MIVVVAGAFAPLPASAGISTDVAYTRFAGCERFRQPISRRQMMMNIARLVNEDDWYEMVESHPAHEIKMYVMSALELHHYEVRVEHDHSVWISIAPSLDGRLLGPIRHVHRRQVMVWYEIHVAGRIPV